MECPFCGSRETGHTGWRGSDPIYTCDQCGARFDDEGYDVMEIDSDGDGAAGVDGINDHGIADDDGDFDQTQLRLPGNFRSGEIYF